MQGSILAWMVDGTATLAFSLRREDRRHARMHHEVCVERHRSHLPSVLAWQVRAVTGETRTGPTIGAALLLQGGSLLGGRLVDASK